VLLVAGPALGIELLRPGHLAQGPGELLARIVLAGMDQVREGALHVEGGLRQGLQDAVEQARPEHGAVWVCVLVYLAGVYGGYFGAAQGVLLLGLLGIGLDESLPRINALKNVLAMLVNGVAGVVFIVAVVLVVMLAYEELESRVLVPRIYGRSLRLPSSVVMFSLLAGGTLMTRERTEPGAQPSREDGDLHAFRARHSRLNVHTVLLKR